MLLTPTRIYAKQILTLVEEYPINGIAHITGGGITENLPRVFPSGVRAQVRRKAWSVPPIFQAIAGLEQVEREEMYRVFNMGIGLILVVPASAAQCCLVRATSLGDPAARLGLSWHRPARNRWWSMSTKRTMRSESPSWHPDAGQSSGRHRRDRSRDGSGKDRRRHQQQERRPGARTRPPAWSPASSSILSPYAGRPDSREAYDRDSSNVLQQHNVELVLLAGYMKIVTSVLVEAFANRMMNIHPSLLPSFPGLDVQKKAIEWGCKLAGCTVHFVTEGVDEGPIILQAAFRFSITTRPKHWPPGFLSKNTRSILERFSSSLKDALRVVERRVVIEGGKPLG